MVNSLSVGRWVSGLCFVLAAACGNGNEGGVEPTPTLSVAATETVVIQRRVLGVRARCNEETSDSFRIDLGAKRLTRLAYVYECAASDGGADAEATPSPDGRAVPKVKGELTLTDAQRDSLLAATNRVQLTKRDACIGYDGTSFSISVERAGGKTEAYGDGISLDCAIAASGQHAIYADLTKLIP